jgi:hypothetical protein
MEVSGQIRAPPLEKEPPIPYALQSGLWVGPRVGLGTLEQSLLPLLGTESWFLGFLGLSLVLSYVLC